MKTLHHSLAAEIALATLVVLGLSPLAAQAQELTGFAGGSAAHGLRMGGYSWMLDYRQGVFERVDASLTWINEGHFAEGSILHHRDGLALQAWQDLFLTDHFGISLGGGSDYYFDSKQVGGQSINLHRFAPIASADLKYYFDPAGHWLVRLRVSEIIPSRDPQHLLLDFGFGHRFGAPQKSSPATQLPTGGQAIRDAKTEKASGPELVALTGLSRINTFARLGSNCAAIEFRHGWKPYLDWSIGYLYEGKTSIVRRSGATAEGWLMSDSVRLASWLASGIGVGAGTYVNLSAKNQPPGAASTTVPLFAGLVTPTVYFKICQRWSARVEWHRVVTSYNTDADVWLVGVGYSWH